MAAGIKGTIDWVGYPVGLLAVPPATVGFRGLLDFVGYSVGLPGLPAATVGFKGLLDFIGYSVGEPSGGAPSAPPMRTLMGVGT